MRPESDSVSYFDVRISNFKSMIKKTYKVSGMDCTSCAMLIESDLEDAGVKSTCRYAAQMLEVEFDEQETSEQTIKEVVKKSGYTLE